MRTTYHRIGKHIIIIQHYNVLRICYIIVMPFADVHHNQSINCKCMAVHNLNQGNAPLSSTVELLIYSWLAITSRTDGYNIKLYGVIFEQEHKTYYFIVSKTIIVLENVFVYVT